MNALVKTIDGLNIALGWVVGAFMAIATISVLAQVVIRFVLPLVGLAVSAPWTEELARYLMIWVVFLGVAVLCRSFRLIAVEMVVVALPERAGIALRLLAVAICVAFLCVLASVGYGWTSMSGIESSPVMRIPMTWIYSAMPVGAAIAILNMLVYAVEIATERRRNVEQTAEIGD